MTTQEQVADTTGAQADAAAQTVSRSELESAIAARQAAKERARQAEEKLAQIEAAEAQRARKEAEEQGRFKDLADAAEARAAELEAANAATAKRLEVLTARHRATVEARFAGLPEAARQKLTERLGEAPELDALENAVALAESLQTPSAVSPRAIGGQASPGRQSPLIGSGKADPGQIAKMSMAERAAYLAKNYRR